MTDTDVTGGTDDTLDLRRGHEVDHALAGTTDLKDTHEIAIETDPPTL